MRRNREIIDVLTARLVLFEWLWVSRKIIHWRIRWLGLVTVYYYVHYARQTRTINQVMPYLMEFKSPGGFEIHRVRKYLVNVGLFGIQDLEICKILVKLKGNMYDGPLNIFPNFWHCHFIITLLEELLPPSVANSPHVVALIKMFAIRCKRKYYCAAMTLYT